LGDEQQCGHALILALVKSYRPGKMAAENCVDSLKQWHRLHNSVYLFSSMARFAHGRKKLIHSGLRSTRLDVRSVGPYTDVELNISSTRLSAI